MAYPSQFQDLYNEVIQRLRLDATDDLARTKQWINRVYARAYMETLYGGSSASTSALTAGDTSVALPTTVLAIEFVVTVKNSVQSLPLSQIPLRELLERRGNVQTSSAQDGPSAFALRGSTIELWPAAAGGETVKVYGAVLPTALSGTTDVPSMPEPYATEVLTYGALVEGADFKRDPNLGEYRQMYEQWMAKWRAFVRRRQGAEVQAGRVYRGEGRTGIPHDPSTDVRW